MYTNNSEYANKVTGYTSYIFSYLSIYFTLQCNYVFNDNYDVYVSTLYVLFSGISHYIDLTTMNFGSANTSVRALVNALVHFYFICLPPLK